MNISVDFIEEVLLDYAHALRTGELDGAGRYFPEAVEEEVETLTGELQRRDGLCPTCRELVGEALARKCPASG